MITQFVTHDVYQLLTLSIMFLEMMRKCLMINTPWIFTTLWYLIRGWLAEKTANKVSLFGGDYATVIDAEIPKESLPVLAGGQNKDGMDESLVFAFNLGHFIPVDPKTDCSGSTGETVATSEEL